MNSVKVLGILLVAFVTGCSSQQHRNPVMHDFGVPNPVYSSARNALLTVTAPTWLWDNRIRYRLMYEATTAVRFYGQDIWLAPPPELFEQFLLMQLPSNGLAISIRMLSLEQQFSSIKQAKVILSFSAEVYSTEHQQLKSKVFTLQQTTPTPDAAGAVLGIIQLNQEALNLLQNWLRP